MPRFPSIFLVFGAIAAFGCDRQQPTDGSMAKGKTGSLTAPAKPPSSNLATTTEQPDVTIPPVVQQQSGTIQPINQGRKVELGDLEQRPVLFFELRSGMVIRVSDIKYDKLGWVDSYVASVQLDKGEEAKVLVRTETPAGDGKAPTHAATVNGKPVPRQSDKNLVGFSVKDIGGVVLARSAGAGRLNMQTTFLYDSTGRQDGAQQAAQEDGKTFAINTKFSYGPTGRQYLARQDVQHEGKSISIAYSDYRWEESGRPAGYTAQVVKAE